MSPEELKNEIEKMICPWHMKHPTVEIGSEGELDIKTCCDKFNVQIFKSIDCHLLDDENNL
jgi:hypothetical protein